MAVVKAVSVDYPPRDIAVLDEALGGLRGPYSFLYARTLAGRSAPSEQAVVLDVEVKFNILDSYC